MKKTWLYSAVAGIALLATACANNAAPNAGPNGATTQNYAGPRANYDISGGPAGIYNGTTRGTDFFPNGYNAGTMRNYNAFNGADIRGGNQPGMGGNTSIYRNNGLFGRAGVMQNGMSQMGYVRVNRSFITNNANATNNVFVDRDALARVVGNVTASCPGVNASTVLVTDEECFVGLDLMRNFAGGQAGAPNGGQAGGLMRGFGTQTGQNGQVGQTGQAGGQTNLQSVIAQARANAMSVCPRYYKVYVTDNQQIIDEMTRLASRSTNMGAGANQTFDDTGVDALVRRMGDLPDGQDLTTRGSTMTTEMHRTHKFKGTTTNNMGTTSR